MHSGIVVIVISSLTGLFPRPAPALEMFCPYGTDLD
jgi:hypothetical protein